MGLAEVIPVERGASRRPDRRHYFHRAQQRRPSHHHHHYERRPIDYGDATTSDKTIIINITTGSS